MGGPKRVFKFRIKHDRFLGLLLVAVGITIIAVMLLPYTVWIVLLGIVLIIAGYKLFLC